MRSTTEQDRVATLAFRYRGTPHGWLTEDSKFAETAIRKRRALGYHSREAVAPSDTEYLIWLQILANLGSSLLDIYYIHYPLLAWNDRCRLRGSVFRLH